MLVHRSDRSRSRVLLVSAALAALCGCASATCTEPSVPPEADAPAPEAESAIATEPSLRLVITPTLQPTPQVHVAIELTGPAAPDETLRNWSLLGPVVGPFTPRLRDAAGELEAAIEAAGEGVRVTLARAPSLPLMIEYTLAPAPAGAGQVARIALDDTQFFATGEALLLLPDDAVDQRRALSIHVAADALAIATDGDTPTGMPPLRAGTSFAAKAESELQAWPFELRRAVFVGGLLEWAQFDSISGDDRWLGLRPTRFDHRWPAAELAAMRAAVDGRIGMPTLDPMVTILLGTPRSESEPPFAAELRGRGLLILADQNALWDASARLTSTQALAARWLGGRVRVTEPKLDHPGERSLWFDAGVTRYVARELLFELGLLSDDEYGAELNRIEFELATSPLRDRTLDELAAIVATGDPHDPAARIAANDARSVLAARGSIYLAWLDQELRNVQSMWATDDGIEVLRILVATAIAKERREFGVGEFVHIAAFMANNEAPRDASFLAQFEAVVNRGERPKLGAGSFGECFRPRQRKLARFELGFVDSAAPDDARPSFSALDPNGPAAKAGLRADDSLISIDYVYGDPDQQVRLRVAREGGERTIQYRPAGPSQTAVQWERVAGVPSEACVR